MTSEVKAYVEYVKTSFSDLVKALGLFILLGAGPFLAALLNIAEVDGWTILYVGTIEEIIGFVVLFILGKRGVLFKNLRQEDFQKTPKKGAKEPAELEEEEEKA